MDIAAMVGRGMSRGVPLENLAEDVSPMIFYSPPSLSEATVLEEGIDDQVHQRVTMKILP